MQQYPKSHLSPFYVLENQALVRDDDAFVAVVEERVLLKEREKSKKL